MPNTTAISKKRFALWTVVFSTGCGLLLVADHQVAQGFAFMVIYSASLIHTTPAEYRRKLSAREIAGAFGIVFLLFLFITLNIFFPGLFPDLGWTGASISHPAFVLPLWALGLWVFYRQASRSWKKELAGVAG